MTELTRFSSLMGIHENGLTDGLTGDSARILADVLNDIVSVKDFGAKGDGTTDDTTAVQNAMDALSSGGVLYFPAGAYKLTAQLVVPSNQNYSMRGAGMEVTRLFWTNSAGGVYWNATGFARFKSFTIEGMSLTTTYAGGGTAIQVGDGSSVIESAVTFRDLAITGNDGVHETSSYWTRGVYLYGLRFAVFENVRIWGKDGISTSYESTEGVYLRATTSGAQVGFCFSNFWVSNFRYGIRGEGWLEGIYVQNGEIWNCEKAISIDRTGATMAGALFVKNMHTNAWAGNVFAKNMNAVCVTGCDIYHGCAPPSGAMGSNMINLETCDMCIVSGNKFETAYSTSTNGVYLTDVDGCNVSGNLFYNINDTGVVCASGTSDTFVTGNSFMGGGNVMATAVTFLSGSERCGARANFIGANVTDGWANAGTNTYFGGRGALIKKTSSQAITSGAGWVKLTWDASEYDRGGWFDNSNDRLIVPAGVNRVRVSCMVTAGDPGGEYSAGVRIIKNGGWYLGCAYSQNRVTYLGGNLHTATMEVVAGDYFEVQMQHAYGSDVTIDGSSGVTWMSIEAVE